MFSGGMEAQQTSPLPGPRNVSYFIVSQAILSTPNFYHCVFFHVMICIVSDFVEREVMRTQSILVVVMALCVICVGACRQKPSPEKKPSVAESSLKQLHPVSQHNQS